MKRNCLLSMLLVTGVATAIAQAGVPKPDAIVYGQVRIGDELIRATDDVAIVAWVDGIDQPVTAYRMGANPTAGDHYVLRFPMAVQDDGRTPSPDTAAPGEMASVYLVDGTGAEEYLGYVAIPKSGNVRRRDLLSEGAQPPTQPDPEATPDPEAQPAPQPRPRPQSGCGSMCGAFGMVSMGLTLCGWGCMRYGRTRRRR